MDIKIIASRNCDQRRVLQKRFKKINVPIVTLFIEEDPELVQEFDVMETPNIVINGEVVYRGNAGKPLPTIPELLRLMERKRA
ncbi:hypothetical protein GF337_15460 [candidate division KSB1 bacterium]|nr:hypothetical protein [candidate division KSB1 bacterium]